MLKNFRSTGGAARRLVQCVVFLMAMLCLGAPIVAAEAPAPAGSGTTTADRIEALKAQIKELIQKRDTKGAIPVLQQLIELTPNDPKVRNNLGMMYLMNGKFQEALKQFDKSIQLDPSVGSVFGNRGLVRRRLGDIKGAVADYGEALRLKPDDPQIYYDRGVAYLDSGQTDLALADFDKSIAIDPTMARAYSKRGRIRHKAGDPEAGPDFRRALAYDRKYQEAREQLELLAAEAPAEIKALDKKIEEEPYNPELYYQRALIYQNLRGDSAFFGLMVESMGDLDLAIEFDERFTKAYLARGRLNDNLFRLNILNTGPTGTLNRAWYSERALADYHKYLELGGKDPAATEWSAMLKTTSYRLEDAAKQTKDLAAAYPSVPRYQELSDRLSADVKRDEDKIAELSRRIAQSEQDAKAYQQRGILRLVLGYTKDAIEDLRAARELDPNQFLADLNYPRALESAGLNDEALAAYDQAIENGSPETVETAHYARAILLEKMGRLEEAQEEWTRTLNLYSKSALDSGHLHASRVFGKISRRGLLRQQAAQKDFFSKNQKKTPSIADRTDAMKKMDRQTEDFYKKTLLSTWIEPRSMQRLTFYVSTALEMVQKWIPRALEAYKTSYDDYPSTEEGLKILKQKPGKPITRPDGTTAVDSIYEHTMSAFELIDPWGNPYVYVYPGKKRPGSYDLYSKGLNGRDDGERGDDLWSIKDPIAAS